MMLVDIKAILYDLHHFHSHETILLTFVLSFIIEKIYERIKVSQNNFVLIFSYSSYKWTQTIANKMPPTAWHNLLSFNL